MGIYLYLSLFVSFVSFCLAGLGLFCCLLFPRILSVLFGWAGGLAGRLAGWLAGLSLRSVPAALAPRSRSL